MRRSTVLNLSLWLVFPDSVEECRINRKTDLGSLPGWVKYCSVVSYCVWHFHPSLIFTPKTKSYQSGLYFKGRLPASFTNIILGQKWLAVTNALAYHTAVTITKIKSFIVQFCLLVGFNKMNKTTIATFFPLKKVLDKLGQMLQNLLSS